LEIDSGCFRAPDRHQSGRQFLKALELAGVALPTDAIDVIDLFKKK
jgi:hypothetical protein